MIVSVEEMKNYLRVDYDEDDGLIENYITSAERLCMDILRTDDRADLEAYPTGRTAVLYTVAFFYEHREEADILRLTLDLRALLSGERKAAF